VLDPASYDEWFAADGTVRPHQQKLHTFFTNAQARQIEGLQRAIRSRINEQEVSFNILGAPGGSNRPWQLDAVPWVWDTASWTALEKALQQRARLLSLIYEDLYGAQRLLKERVVPAELVLGHPELTRACFGWKPLGGHRLHVYAADVGRDEQGRLWVYSDRAAAPTGAGYALENRFVLGRALSGLFNDYGVERVRGFFDTLRRSVQELASANDTPRVVLLTSGSHDESSFEHAYLARYLGYELVEGGDLTVRDRVVYLKTLSGLRRVDVIFRRVHDAWCDPLTLRGDSLIGVPGLVEAAQANNVALANPLGVNVMESAAFKAYLPGAAQLLLGEPLLIDSVETHWCGDPQALGRVLERLTDFVIKPAFEDRRGDPTIVANLTKEERERLAQRIQATPSRYVAERWPSLSSLPVATKGNFGYGRVALRAFLTRDADDYRLMPGGLARVNAAPDGLFLSIGGSEASKDVWVPALAQGWGRVPLGMPDARVELRRGGLDLPSRLLDDIFWLGRYVERCDMTARLLRAAFERLGSEAGGDVDHALNAIVDALEALEIVKVAVGTRSVATFDALFTGAMMDAQYPSSLKSMCSRVHHMALTVRSRLSRDAWHVLRRLSRSLDGLHGEITPAAAIETLDEMLITLSAVGGSTLDNMVRGHAWVFLDMGRRLERGASILSLVRALLPAGATRLHMEALLEVADSLMTYRARYLSSLQVAPVVDLLLTDDTNPRSLLFQVNTVLGHVRQLPRLGDVVLSRAERKVIALQSSLLTADLALACAGDGAGLRALLEDASNLLWQCSEDITQTWFTHAVAAHPMAAPQWINEELEAT
jgi:uncharacterized circularly permuted ATP-grasp superfamily protein/uncharacterized alpha-E superfamily protein